MVQGTTSLAWGLAQGHPGFDIVLATSETDDPSKRAPEMLNGGKTMLVSVGKRGKYVGVFGFYPNKETPVRFQLETLDKRYDGTGAPMKHLIQDQYRETLKLAGVVEKIVRRNFVFVRRDSVKDAPMATFIGAATCAKCHPKTFEFWSGTPHAFAFDSLLDDPKPNTQFDAECITCHTTGFEYNSGWVSQAKTPDLVGNQCENCHGPGSQHAAEPDNAEFRKLLTVSADQADKTLLCHRCHDEDNSREFTFKGYWPLIKHNKLDKYTDPKVHKGIASKAAAPQ
jgi:hypothetical protein